MGMSLNELQMLARERLPSKRHELLRALADALFDPSQGLSDRERELFDDIIEKVLDDVEPMARLEFAERLAGRTDAPHCVVKRLAGDIIAVAAPVLNRSPLLCDDDLAQLARNKSQDHLLAIARRVELSERITDILVDRGDGLVLDSIAENIGARFSQSGAAALIEKAQLRESLWRRLADRADLAMQVADALAPSASTGRDLAHCCRKRENRPQRACMRPRRGRDRSMSLRISLLAGACACARPSSSSRMRTGWPTSRSWCAPMAAAAKAVPMISFVICSRPEKRR
jgi:uncharacterized protein (DUF2336 family)